MTTYVQARDAVVLLVNTAWTGGYSEPVFFENTLQVDLDTVPNGFLRVEIEFSDSEEATLDQITRTYGILYLTVFVKVNTGTRLALSRMDYLTNVAKFVRVSNITLGAPTPGPKVEHNGWVGHELRVPFQFDSLT